jgi:hypothetical protein
LGIVAPVFGCAADAEYTLDRSDLMEFKDSWLVFSFLLACSLVWASAGLFDGTRFVDLTMEFNRLFGSTASFNFSTFCIGANTPYKASH